MKSSDNCCDHDLLTYPHRPGLLCYGKCHSYTSCKWGDLGGPRGGCGVATMLGGILEGTQDRGY